MWQQSHHSRTAIPSLCISFNFPSHLAHLQSTIIRLILCVHRVISWLTYFHRHFTKFHSDFRWKKDRPRTPISKAKIIIKKALHDDTDNPPVDWAATKRRSAFLNFIIFGCRALTAVYTCYHGVSSSRYNTGNAALVAIVMLPVTTEERKAPINGINSNP